MNKPGSPSPKFLRGKTHIPWVNHLTHKKLLSQIIFILHPEYFPVVGIYLCGYHGPILSPNYR